MGDAYVYLHPGPKAHVRKVRTPEILRWADQDPAATSTYSWEAGKPGIHYLVGRGFHFDRWQDAMDYATEHRQDRQAQESQ